MRAFIYFCAFYCTFIFADWKVSLRLLQKTAAEAGLEEINEIQDYIWKQNNSQLKSQLNEALEDYLKSAPMIDSFDVGSSRLGAGPAKKGFVVLEGGMRALFKHQEGKEYQNSTMQKEVLAYELNKLWNVEIVPVTVERKIDGVVGSLQLWVPFYLRSTDYVDDLGKVSKYYWMRVFDYLINEPDRHKGNFLVGRQVVAIDNGYCLSAWGRRQEYSVRIPPEVKGDIQLAKNLELGNLENFNSLLGPHIGEKIRRQILSRRYEVLRFIYSDQTHAEMLAYPSREWVYSVKPQRVSFPIKDIQSKNGIEVMPYLDKKYVLRKIIDERSVLLKIPKNQEGRLRGIKFTYASQSGVEVILRSSVNDNLIIAKHLLPSSGSNEKWKNIIVATAEWLDREEELELVFLNPSRNSKPETAFVSVIELEFELESNETMSNSNMQLRPELEVGSTQRIADHNYKLIERMGRGGFGVVYKVEDENHRIKALKIARSEGALPVVLLDERQRFSLLKEVPNLITPQFYVLGSNFVIKDFFEGVSAEEFLKNFDIKKTQDVEAILKLIEVFKNLSRKGIFAPAHNLTNWLYNGQDWVNVDTSDRIEMGLFEYEALRKYRSNFEDIWLKKNQYLESFMSIWNALLESPSYNNIVGDCEYGLAV